MNDLTALLQQGATNAWLFIPSAILLGALHGLEPGHSKTMMAAFIVAVRGTLWQAVLLGLSATLSHTLVVWIVAVGGLYFGQRWSAETSEPYMQIGSAVVMIGVAAWMMWRLWHEKPSHHQHDHEHSHNHDHDHRHDDHHVHTHDEGFHFPDEEYADEHERAHAEDIRRRFANRHVTTGQIVLFGLTGGLIPCPASITVLLICLQLKQFTLGATLVLCFSIGLALTLVMSGVIAALSVKHLASRWHGFGEFGRRAPYVSAVLILFVGLYVGYEGVHSLT